MDNTESGIYNNSTPSSGGRAANTTILAIPGSLRAGSSNHAILNFIGSILSAKIDYHIYDALVTIPPFEPGLDNDVPPQAVSDLRDKISQADAIIICTPEYAYGVPGQLKNALDWMVSSSSFVNKPVALITASLGGESAHAAMQLIFGALSAKLNPEAMLLIQFIRSKVNADGAITDEETAEKINSVVGELLKTI